MKASLVLTVIVHEPTFRAEVVRTEVEIEGTGTVALQQWQDTVVDSATQLAEQVGIGA